jgi:predicted AlkP superfamily phosphohydrolase/phosphomutase
MNSIREKRVVIVGLDGVPFGLIENFTDNGLMPETKKLIENGLFVPMESSIPEISSVAWSSMITGKNPGEHGIFGYTDIPLGTYRLSFPNFNNLKAEPFWQIYGREKSIIINVPATFPVKPLNGIHISGFVSLDLKRSVYPESLIQKLNELNYRIDVDASKAHQSIDMFLNDLDKTLKARIAAYRFLWREEDWQTFMLVFTGTDRLSHFLWDAFEDENHPYCLAFIEHFRQIDGVIGEIAEDLSDEDVLVLLSDHGFEPLEKEVNINFLLKENGFLRLKPGSERNYADIESGTRAFALEPARIYVHSKDKYPRGSVKKSEYQKVIEELISIFKDLEDGGKRIIKEIFQKEEIYRGSYLDQAPDIVLIPNQGFNLKASLKANELYEKTIFTGKHTQHDAFLLIKDCSGQDIIPEKPSVSDVCKIMDKLRSQR